MARKKQEVQLLREIESQEEWEDIMGKEGLWVVDVFQEWSGPCDAMVSNFRRIKNELGDDHLHFAMAKSDSIEALEKYRGSCEPCFLFFAAGVLVSYVHGANAPLILRTLTEQLAQEHKVLDGSSERKEVKDPFVANRESADDLFKDEEEEGEDGESYVPHRRISTYPGDYEEDGGKFEYKGEVVIYDDELAPATQYEEVKEGYTVAIIKPNAVADGKVDEILAEMKAQGIKVLAQEQRQLTEEEAREFYSNVQGETYFEDLVEFMSSGPSHVLVLTKGQSDDGVIQDWREMLGPPAVEDAKEKAPDSLRARYGQAGLMNALHGSDSQETAARELAFFFPKMQAPTLHQKKKEIQRTLALVRPDAFATNKDAILDKIKEAGFQIALQKVVTLSKEQAEEFYKEHAGQPYFEELTTRMSSGPMLALGLAREDAVENWRGLLGPADLEEAKTAAPDSLRAQFAVDECPVNPLHGSDSAETAKQELEYFFPMEQTVAMIKPDAYGTKDAIVDRIHEAGFRIAARKETTITREIAESFYEDQKDKDYYNDLVEHMISGPTMFMVLSREGAVDGWRQEIGPTDPEQAKSEAPASLRAQFGSDVLHNAVHGCSTREQAQSKIDKIFGSLAFNPDGTVQASEEAAEEQAVTGTSGIEAAEVAPEYRQQAEQQQQQEQQQEEAQEEQGQQEEKQQEAAGQPEEQAQEEQGQQEEKQPEGEEKTEAEAEKPAEEEGGEKTESGDQEEKPSEETKDGADKTEAAPSEDKEEAADRDVEAESSHSGIDIEAAENSQTPISVDSQRSSSVAPGCQGDAGEEGSVGDSGEEHPAREPVEQGHLHDDLTAAEDTEKDADETSNEADPFKEPVELDDGSISRGSEREDSTDVATSQGLAAQEEAAKEEQPPAEQGQEQQQETAGEQQKAEGEATQEQAAEEKREEAAPAVEEQKEDAPAEAAKEEESKAEEQKEESQSQEAKAGDEKEEAAESKPAEGEEPKAEDGTQQKDSADAAPKN